MKVHGNTQHPLDMLAVAVCLFPLIPKLQYLCFPSPELPKPSSTSTASHVHPTVAYPYIPFLTCSLAL